MLWALLCNEVGKRFHGLIEASDDLRVQSLASAVAIREFARIVVC